MGCLFACFRVKESRNAPSEALPPEIGCQDHAARRNQLAALILSEGNGTNFGRNSLNKHGERLEEEDRFSKICEAVLERDHGGSRKRYEKKDLQKGEEDEKADRFVKEFLPSDPPLENKSTLSTPRGAETKVNSKVEDTDSELTEEGFLTPTEGKRQSVDPGQQGSLTSVSADMGLSRTDPLTSPEGRKVNSDRSGTPKSVEVDRPIIGMVAAHWREDDDDDKKKVPLKTWDGNGIPNSTNKYKEDQRVSWHATPFEERLEKALSDERSLSRHLRGNRQPADPSNSTTNVENNLIINH